MKPFFSGKVLIYMNIQKIQQISLKIFFPAMYLCAFTVIVALWVEAFIGPDDEEFYKLIPTFFVIGLASLITWLVTVIIELKNIVKIKK